MNTIFMNSKSSKTSDTHRLLLNLTEKKSWRKGENMLLYQIVAFTMPGKI